PAYVGDAIAEEKERKTLDYLLTTHLKDREIVLGKLISRLANVLLFLLAGLPILSLTQLLGGVSPELLWSGFAATLLTLLSVAGISLFQSLYATKSRNAIMLTYLLLLCYVVSWGMGEYILDVIIAPPRGTFGVAFASMPGKLPTPPPSSAGQVGLE